MGPIAAAGGMRLPPRGRAFVAALWSGAVLVSRSRHPPKRTPPKNRHKNKSLDQPWNFKDDPGRQGQDPRHPLSGDSRRAHLFEGPATRTSRERRPPPCRRAQSASPATHHFFRARLRGAPSLAGWASPYLERPRSRFPLASCQAASAATARSGPTSPRSLPGPTERGLGRLPARGPAGRGDAHRRGSARLGSPRLGPARPGCWGGGA